MHQLNSSDKDVDLVVVMDLTTLTWIIVVLNDQLAMVLESSRLFRENLGVMWRS